MDLKLCNSSYIFRKTSWWLGVGETVDDNSSFFGNDAKRHVLIENLNKEIFLGFLPENNIFFLPWKVSDSLEPQHT